MLNLLNDIYFYHFTANIDVMESESEADDDIPMVFVAGKSIAIDEVNDEIIAQMSHQEKETYIQVYQEHYSHMYD